MVSLDYMLTPLVCLCSGVLQQCLGPLTVLRLSCLPYTLARLLAALATQPEHLDASRVLEGVSHASGSVAPIVPVTAFLACFLVPESPVFLVARGKLGETEQNLC